MSKGANILEVLGSKKMERLEAVSGLLSRTFEQARSNSVEVKG